MNCLSCESPIEFERLEILPNTRVCSCCAKQGMGQGSKPRGVLVFDHKTGGSIQILSAEAHKEWKRYNPYGRYTGRGSGVHRMMSSSAK